MVVPVTEVEELEEEEVAEVTEVEEEVVMLLLLLVVFKEFVADEEEDPLFVLTKCSRLGSEVIASVESPPPDSGAFPLPFTSSFPVVILICCRKVSKLSISV